jgi:hypothetical protein
MRLNKTDRRRQVPPQSEPLILPIKQVSAMLGGVGIGKVKSLIKAGLLDGVMVGPAYYVKTASLRRFADRGERPAASAKARNTDASAAP